MHARTRVSPPPLAPRPSWFAALGAAGVFGTLLLLYGDAFRMPFLSDDGVFLDHTHRVPFARWWGFRYLFFHYWRPWSREFHYGALQAAFGPNAMVFHLASFALIAGCLVAFFALSRSLAGARAAAFASAGLVAMAAWGMPALSISGVQDLWMILASLLAVRAWIAGRTGLATLALAIALMSKETACLVPGLFLAYDLAVARRPARETIRRLAVPALLVLAWAAVHPQLGGRRLWHVNLGPGAPERGATLELPLRALGSLASLDRLPVPEDGWLRTVLFALPAAFVLAAGAWLLAEPAPERTLPGGRGLARFALAWMLCGWLPLALPSLGWHAYYGLFGAFGAWLLLGAWLATAPTAVGAGVAAALVILSAARGGTRTVDWADASYQREAGMQTRELRRSLFELRPQLSPGTRLYFSADPASMSFLLRMLAEEGANFRVWYRDDRLRARYLEDYAPRRPGSIRGEDLFFRLDADAAVRERPVAARDTTSGPATPAWRADHEELGRVFARAGDSRGAGAEFALLASRIPDDFGLAWRACATAHDAGDLAEARRWWLEAERRAGGDPRAIEALMQVRGELFATSR